MGDMEQTTQKLIKEFHNKYDFSESKTLEYDNLVGIADFIEQAIAQAVQQSFSEIWNMGYRDGRAKKPKTKAEMESEIEYKARNQHIRDVEDFKKSLKEKE